MPSSQTSQRFLQLPGDRKWLFLLLICPVFLIGCWTAPFSDLDDYQYIVGNAAVQHDAPWSMLFSFRDDRVADVYVPVLYLVFRVERFVFEPLLKSIAGSNAFACGIRTGNLIAHAGVCFIVWILMRRFGAGPRLSAFVMGATALHPTVCHCLCWCYEGKTIYSALIGFAAVTVYMNARTAWHSALSVMLYGLSLLIYPRAMGLLLVVVCWEVMRRPRMPADFPPGEMPPQRPSLRIVILTLAPWVLLTVADFWINVAMTNMDRVILPPIGGSIWTAAMTDVPVLQRYIYNLLIPLNLAADYGIAAIVSLSNPRLYVGVLCLALFVGATVALSDRSARKLVIFGWLWFLGALLPVLNFKGINNLMNDCYIYYSAPAFWLIVGLSIQGAARRIAGIAPAFRIPVGNSQYPIAAVLICLTLVSAKRSYLYADTFSLYEDSARREPDCSLTHLVFAQELRGRMMTQLDRGDRVGAEHYADRELSELQAGIAGLNFERTWLDINAYLWLSRSYFEHLRFEEAIAQIEKLRRNRPYLDLRQNAASLHDWGREALKRKDFANAMRCFDYGSFLNPGDCQFRMEKIRLLLQLRQSHLAAGSTDKARECARLALDAARQVPQASDCYGDSQVLVKELESAP